MSIYRSSNIQMKIIMYEFYVYILITYPTRISLG